MVQVIRVQRRLSTVEGEGTDLLVDLTDGAEGVDEQSSATSGLRVDGALLVVPLGVGGVRDQLMPEENVHQDILLLQRLARHDGVTEHGSVQLLVDVGVGVVQDLTGQSGDVDTTIGLTSQPGLAADKLGVGLQETFDELEVVASGLIVAGGVVVVGVGGEGESDTTGLLKVDNVGVGVPGVLGEVNVS